MFLHIILQVFLILYEYISFTCTFGDSNSLECLLFIVPLVFLILYEYSFLIYFAFSVSNCL